MKKEIISTILRMVFAAAGMVFIILSMCLDQTQPYLTIGLAFVVLANLICWVAKGLKKGN
ncbi:MAG: hypothetical protein J5625_00045 [Lachnospiraceae bacterium]|nr:hypothetical protein [Lachnospiraceae bacterium]